MTAVIDSHRFAAGFTDPSDLDDLEGWWDASDSGTIADTGGSVTQWNDKSINGYDVTNLTGTVTTDSRTMNSLNVLDFPGSAVLGKASVTLAQPYTLYYAAQWDASTGVAISFQDGFSYGPYWWLSNKIRAYNGTVLEESGASADTSPHTFAVVVDNTSSLLYLDGSQIASGTLGTKTITRINFGAATSGGSTSFNGGMGEIVLASSAHGSDTRSDVETYLADKWIL